MAKWDSTMAKWDKKSVRMDPDHGWRSKPGYKIFVADRGAVRFDFPEDWVVIADAEGIRLHDREPPNDECRIQLSVFRLPPEVDLSGLPIAAMLADALAAHAEGVISETPITHVLRPGLEIVWREVRQIDEREQRESRSRHLLARAKNINPFLTLDFWPEDEARLNPVWAELVRSLRVGEFVADPRKGPQRKRR